MGYAFANKSHLSLEPGPSKQFAIDAILVAAYATPAAYRLTVDDLARLQYLKGSLRYALNLDAAAASGVLLVKLMTGTTVLAQVSHTLAGAETQYGGVITADISTLKGTDVVFIQVDVTTAAPASRKASVSAVLDITHPLVIGG